MLILMSICLLADPSTCREERLSFSFEQANPMTCMIRSQETIAEWKESHPDWTVSAWKCVSRGRVPVSL
jgi:hypothetical protein